MMEVLAKANENKVRGERAVRGGQIPIDTMRSALALKLARMEIHDLSREYGKDDDPDLPNFLQAHFNPKEVEETIKVHWNEITIPGMSHQRLQYHFTENVPFKFDLHFDGLQALDTKPGTLRGTGGPSGIQQAKNFLQSLCYPRAGAQSVLDGAPPHVLFLWPNFMEVTCVVSEQKWTNSLFCSDGTPRRFTCSMHLKEVRTTRLSSQQVLRNGNRRWDKMPGDGEGPIKVE